MPTEDIGELIRKACYPAPFVKHPNIGHVNMVDKIFPYLKPELFNFEQYMSYYKAAYMLLCRDFNNYISYLNDAFWEDFFNKRKNRKKND